MDELMTREEFDLSLGTILNKDLIHDLEPIRTAYAAALARIEALTNIGDDMANILAYRGGYGGIVLRWREAIGDMRPNNRRGK